MRKRRRSVGKIYITKHHLPLLGLDWIEAHLIFFPCRNEIWNPEHIRVLSRQEQDLFWRSGRAVSPTFTWEKWEDTKLPHNEWTPHIHFRGTSFSHYIAINSTGCGLYLVSSWSRPRDMRLLTHDSSLIFILAPHHICPKTNLFLSENENFSSPNHGIKQRGMLAYAADKLRWKNGHFDSQFLGWIWYKAAFGMVSEWWQLQLSVADVQKLQKIRSDWQGMSIETGKWQHCI